MFAKTIMTVLTALTVLLVLELGFGIELGLERAIDREQAAIEAEFSSLLE